MKLYFEDINIGEVDNNIAPRNAKIGNIYSMFDTSGTCNAFVRQILGILTKIKVNNKSIYNDNNEYYFKVIYCSNLNEHNYKVLKCGGITKRCPAEQNMDDFCEIKDINNRFIKECLEKVKFIEKFRKIR